MRLFIAVNLPPDEKDRLYRAAAPLRAAGFPVRWVEPDAIHITLKFLGEVGEERVTGIRDAIRRVAAEADRFGIGLGGFGAFPDVTRPRVVWAGIAHSAELQHVQARVDVEMERLGFPRDSRPFHPHLTLGRAPGDARAADFRGFAERIAGLEYGGSLDVHSLDLMQSLLSPRGARYERVLAAELGEGKAA
ncbi:MAG: RNA 2',3'-cyclic phosphodiesterase [Gemmatimonadetes bacterium]|nr:RNA 2',3'-cyclic phosphodiesterase [Gemmatimonadota bacterium]